MRTKDFWETRMRPDPRVDRFMVESRPCHQESEEKEAVCEEREAMIYYIYTHQPPDHYYDLINIFLMGCGHFFGGY